VWRKRKVASGIRGRGRYPVGEEYLGQEEEEGRQKAKGN
jgi:hypothetical protein